ncbi:MAG: hypothetical protein ABIO73_02280 [Polaromonas sp.]
MFHKQKFDALAPELQNVLLSAAADGRMFQRNLNQKNEASIIADLRKNGMTVIETFDPAPFKALVNDDLRKTFTAKNGPELLLAGDTLK